jgi:hypothetical protein
MAAAGASSNLTPEDIDRRIAELHKLHKNQVPSLPKVQIFIFVTFNQYGLEGQVFWQSF